jgi:hypothetical protein
MAGKNIKNPFVKIDFSLRIVNFQADRSFFTIFQIEQIGFVFNDDPFFIGKDLF